MILRDLEGLSYEEIAEILECSVRIVKSRILRGRRALKDLLEPLLSNRSVSTHESCSSTSDAENIDATQQNRLKFHGSASRMPHRPFAPSNAQRSANSAGHTKFSQQGSESGDLS